MNNAIWIIKIPRSALAMLRHAVYCKVLLSIILFTLAMPKLAVVSGRYYEKLTETCENSKIIEHTKYSRVSEFDFKLME